MPRMNSRETPPISQIALVSEQRCRVRDLSGFRRSHQVPRECNDRTRNFVGKIAADDINKDLDDRFDEFRRHLELRRVDMKVSDPENGCGAIVTPWFDYRVIVTQDSQESAEAVWRRQVTDFRETAPLMSSGFSAVFGKLFNTVEFEPLEQIDVEAFVDAMETRGDQAIRIDYDRHCTWCDLSLDRIPGKLTVFTDRVAFVTHHADLPAELLSAFFEFRTELNGIECF